MMKCADLVLQTWFLDDVALAGSQPAVLHALHLIEEMGPLHGLSYELEMDLHVNRRWPCTGLPCELEMDPALGLHVNRDGPCTGPPCEQEMALH